MTQSAHLHLGAHKTATTSFQRLLAVNAKRLREEFGVVNVRSQQFHAFEAYRLISHARAGRDVEDAAVESARAQLASEIGGRGLSVILSHEGLIGQHNLNTDGGMYPGVGAATAVIARVFADFRTSVSFVIRAQPAFLESTYMQAAHYGNFLPFDEYVSGIDLASMSWRRVVTAMREAFGDDRVEVMPFEAIKAGERTFFADLLRPLLGERTDEFMSTARLDNDGKQNASLSQTALTILERTHGTLGREDLRTLIAFMRTAFSNQTHPRAKPCPPRLRRQLLDYFGPENAALFAELDRRYAEHVRHYQP